MNLSVNEIFEKVRNIGCLRLMALRIADGRADEQEFQKPADVGPHHPICSCQYRIIARRVSSRECLGVH